MDRINGWARYVWRNHLTRSWGYFQAALGAFMVYMSQLQPFLKPVHYALLTIACGVLTSLIGFRNSRQRDDKPNEGAPDGHSS